MWKGFQKPKRLASELESLTEKYGRFSAQPFERGWGTTVGNALRRALLSSIEGAAITAVVRPGQEARASELGAHDVATSLDALTSRGGDGFDAALDLVSSGEDLKKHAAGN